MRRLWRRSSPRFRFPERQAHGRRSEPAAAQQPGTPTPGGWAIIDTDGTLDANSNVVQVNHVGPGVYRVVFNQDVSHCAATATLAAHTGRHSIVPGYLVTGRNGKFPTQMRVYTFATTTLLLQGLTLPAVIRIVPDGSALASASRKFASSIVRSA